MRKAFVVKDDYIKELNVDADSVVYALNRQLRLKLKAGILDNTVTMVAVERLSGIAHATLFQWYKGKFDILRVDLLYRLGTVLRVKLTIR